MSTPAQKTPIQKFVDFLASYGLCCILLLFLFLLTLLGTLEQTQMGLYDVQKKYFESLFLVHWLFDKVPVPLPGTYLVLLLLAVNLGLGGFIRIQKRRRTTGVIITHIGIALLLLAGFVKLKFADDGQMTLYESGRADPSLTQSDEYQSYHDWEIAIFDGDTKRDIKEFIIPQEDFLGDLDPASGRSRTFKSPDLPFDLVISNALRNCQALPKGPRFQAKLPVVDGHSLFAEALAKENEQNVAGAYITIKDESGERQAILWGHERYPFAFRSGGKTWGISIRHTRYKLPFAIKLDTFTHEVYPRTQIPKVFMSDVTKIEDGDVTPYKIEMNAPLRHKGFTLFQASYGPSNAPPGTAMFSTFAVTRNPSDHWPLYSCIVISIGLLFVFGEKLVKYTKSQQKKRKAREGQEESSS
jgi:hypothetical protein